MKKNESVKENYLEKIPVINGALSWSSDEKGHITLAISNTGIFNKIAQKVFNKPETSYVHLDEFGSFIWNQIDGKKTIETYGPIVKKHFGEKAEPLYPRLAKFFQVLHSYHFVFFKDDKNLEIKIKGK